MISPEQFENELNLIIKNGFREDVGYGDHTSLSCIPSNTQGKAKLLVKDTGIIAGVAFAKKVLDKTGVLLDPIYTAPMLFQLVQMIENNTWKFGTKILLIHTGGTQGIAGFNAQKNNQWPEV